MKWKQNTLLNVYFFSAWASKQTTLILQTCIQFFQSKASVIDSSNNCKLNAAKSLKNKKSEHQKIIFSWFGGKNLSEYTSI